MNPLTWSLPSFYSVLLWLVKFYCSWSCVPVVFKCRWCLQYVFHIIIQVLGKDIKTVGFSRLLSLIRTVVLLKLPFYTGLDCTRINITNLTDKYKKQRFCTRTSLIYYMSYIWHNEKILDFVRFLWGLGVLRPIASHLDTPIRKDPPMDLYFVSVEGFLSYSWFSISQLLTLLRHKNLTDPMV